jgi:membrane-associated protease RseP (regulator of RpoE activity)
MRVGDTIVQLNGTDIDTWTDVSLFMIDSVSKNTVTVHLLNGTVFDVTLGMNPSNSSKGYFGIYGVDYWEPKAGWEWLGPLYAFNAQMTLQWTFLILFSVGIFNLLPIPALDGDKILSNGISLVMKRRKSRRYRTLGQEYDENLEDIEVENTVKKIMWPIRIFSLGVIVLSIVMTFVTGAPIF